MARGYRGSEMLTSTPPISKVRTWQNFFLDTTIHFIKSYVRQVYMSISKSKRTPQSNANAKMLNVDVPHSKNLKSQNFPVCPPYLFMIFISSSSFPPLPSPCFPPHPFFLSNHIHDLSPQIKESREISRHNTFPSPHSPKSHIQRQRPHFP